MYNRYTTKKTIRLDIKKPYTKRAEKHFEIILSVKLRNEEVWDKIDELQNYYNDLEDSHTL